MRTEAWISLPSVVNPTSERAATTITEMVLSEPGVARECLENIEVVEVVTKMLRENRTANVSCFLCRYLQQLLVVVL